MSKREGYTTIWISRETKRKLDSLKRGRETYDEVLNKLLSGEEGVVFVDFISVDGKPAREHTIIFQLGDQPPRYYRYKNGSFEEIKPGMIEIKVKEEGKDENVNR